MDFMNRGASHPGAPAARASNSEGGPAPSTKRHWKESPLWLRIVWIVLLFSATIVLAALAVLLYFGGPKEANFVDKNKHQAVFLTNGQVYFGKIKSVTSKYLNLEDIFYLNVNQQVQPKQGNQSQQAQISLVKLGCELHRPVDRMVINREQVTFWENLKDDGPVTQGIAKWVQENPNGQKECPTTTTNNSQGSSQETEPAKP